MARQMWNVPGLHPRPPSPLPSQSPFAFSSAQKVKPRKTRISNLESRIRRLFAQKTHHTNKQLQKCFWLLLVTQRTIFCPLFPQYFRCRQIHFNLKSRQCSAQKWILPRVERGLLLCPIVFSGLNLVVRILTCLTLKPAIQPTNQPASQPAN